MSSVTAAMGDPSGKRYPSSPGSLGGIAGSVRTLTGSRPTPRIRSLRPAVSLHWSRYPRWLVSRRWAEPSGKLTFLMEVPGSTFFALSAWAVELVAASVLLEELQPASAITPNAMKARLTMRGDLLITISRFPWG